MHYHSFSVIILPVKILLSYQNPNIAKSMTTYFIVNVLVFWNDGLCVYAFTYMCNEMLTKNYQDTNTWHVHVYEVRISSHCKATICETLTSYCLCTIYHILHGYIQQSKMKILSKYMYKSFHRYHAYDFTLALLVGGSIGWW